MSVGHIFSVLSVLGNGLMGSSEDRLNELVTKYESMVRVQALTSEVNDKRGLLKIPVHQFVYDYYYKTFNEYRYYDLYSYRDRVYVFNHNNDQSRLNEDYQYQNYWLNDLTRMWKHVDREDVVVATELNYHLVNLGWIDGNSGVKNTLKRILRLQLPEVKERNFSEHATNVVFDSGFFHKNHIVEYAGYWQEGSVTKDNLIHRMAYGKLKYGYKDWKDFYSFLPIKHNGKYTCDDVRALKREHLGVDYYMAEGFDASCNTNLSLYRNYYGKGSFYDAPGGLYTSGYVGYKWAKYTYWQDYLYYFMLGHLSKTPKRNVPVRPLNNARNLWYVSYDDIFAPMVTNIDYTDKEIELRVGLNLSKVPDNEQFLKISSGLKFVLSFTLSGVEREIEFDLLDVLKQKVYRVPYLSKSDELALSNFKLRVKSNDDAVVLLEQYRGDFTYRVDLTNLAKNIKLFDSLVFKFDESANYFYSELLDPKRVCGFFYLRSVVNKQELVLPGDMCEKLRVEVTGSDHKSEAILKYHDVVAKKDVSVELKTLLTLPNLSFTYAPGHDGPLTLLKNQNSATTNDYFWSSVRLVMVEENVLGLNAIYKLEAKGQSEVVRAEWNRHLDGQRFNFYKPELKIMDAKKSIVGGDQTLYTDPLEFAKNFELTERARGLGLKLSDVGFTLVSDTTYTLKILAHINKTVKGKTYAGSHTYTFNKVNGVKKTVVEDVGQRVVGTVPKNTSFKQNGSNVPSVILTAPSVVGGQPQIKKVPAVSGRNTSLLPAFQVDDDFQDAIFGSSKEKVSKYYPIIYCCGSICMVGFLMFGLQSISVLKYKNFF